MLKKNEEKSRENKNKQRREECGEVEATGASAGTCYARVGLPLMA